MPGLLLLGYSNSKSSARAACFCALFFSTSKSSAARPAKISVRKWYFYLKIIKKAQQRAFALLPQTSSYSKTRHARKELIKDKRCMKSDCRAVLASQKL